MLPWSVTATAGISSSRIRRHSSPSLLAPSRSEYCVWRWRWTKSAGIEDRLYGGGRPSRRVRARLFEMAFRRALGPFDATMVVVGGIIGSGIFIVPSVVAQRLPTPGLVLAAWATGGAIALAGEFAFAGLAALLPRAGCA